MAVRISNITATFSNSEKTYVGLGLNVNNHASDSNSSIITLKVDDEEKFIIYTNGNTHIDGNLFVNGSINRLTDAGSSESILSTSDVGAVGQFLTSAGSSGALYWRNINVDNVLYVTKDGSDVVGDGSVNNPFLTIRKAVIEANNFYNANNSTSTTISVASGLYEEDMPIEIPRNVSIIGDSLRGVTIKPQISTSDLFYVNNGSYVKELTVRDYEFPSKAFSFHPANTVGPITRSPYILNCTSLNSNGTAVYIDGNVAQGNRSIIAGLFTIINPGGIGVHITNRGYSQLVNIYTICTEIGVLAEQGGFCTLNCSDNSFGTYGLIANGTSIPLYTGTSLGNNVFGREIIIENLPQTPFINHAMRIAGDDEWYTVTGVTPVSGGQSTVTLLQSITTPVANNTAVTFYQRSYIAAAGHAFEYVGTGTNLANASPFAGGITNANNNAISVNGGEVNYTATDQFGNFWINENLRINGSTATIEGEAFQRSIFGLITPYVLAIEGGE